MIDFDTSYKVKVTKATIENWNWCSDNAKGWAVKYERHDTYYFFTNQGDAITFKLRFGL